MGTLEYSDGRSPQVRFRDFESGEIRGTVNFAGYRIQYLSTGHLAGVVEIEGLVVVPFDLDRLAITGPRESVVAGVAATHFSVSESGSLVYLTASSPDDTLSVPSLLQFPQYRRQLDIEPGYYRDIEISPDGNRIVFLKRESAAGASTIWIMDLNSEVAREITGPNVHRYQSVTWMPGGDSVAAARASATGGPQSIHIIATDGTGDERLLLQGRGEMDEIDVSPDGNTVVFVSMAGPNVSVLRAFDVQSMQERTIVGAEGAMLIQNPKVSSENQPIAYEQNETVFIRPLDDSREPFNVARGLAQLPRWSNDGERAIIPDIVEETTEADSEAAPALPLYYVQNWFAELRN